MVPTYYVPWGRSSSTMRMPEAILSIWILTLCAGGQCISTPQLGTKLKGELA